MDVGWFTGMIPVGVPVTAGSFAQTARAAQKSFDAKHRPGEGSVRPGAGFGAVAAQVAAWFPMLAYLDAGLPPLSAVVASHLDGVNARAYSDGLSPATSACGWGASTTRRR